MNAVRQWSRLTRIATSFGLLAGLGACHTFPEDPDATRWPSEPNQPPLTFVSGRVFIRGTATPVQGAVVSSGHLSFSSTTDATGYYALDGIRSVQTLLVVAKPGFDTTRASAQLNGGNVTLNMTLVPQPDSGM